DGGMGLDRRRAVGDRLVAVLLRARRGGAGARPFDLASLSQGRGAGPEPPRRPSASAAKASLFGAVSGRAVRRRGQAASGTVVAAAPARHRHAIRSQVGGGPTPARRRAQGSGQKRYGGATRAARGSRGTRPPRPPSVAPPATPPCAPNHPP